MTDLNNHMQSDPMKAKFTLASMVFSRKELENLDLALWAGIKYYENLDNVPNQGLMAFNKTEVFNKLRARMHNHLTDLAYE